MGSKPKSRAGHHSHHTCHVSRGTCYQRNSCGPGWILSCGPPSEPASIISDSKTPRRSRCLSDQLQQKFSILTSRAWRRILAFVSIIHFTAPDLSQGWEAIINIFCNTLGALHSHSHTLRITLTPSLSLTHLKITSFGIMRLKILYLTPQNSNVMPYLAPNPSSQEDSSVFPPLLTTLTSHYPCSASDPRPRIYFSQNPVVTLLFFIKFMISSFSVGS